VKICVVGLGKIGLPLAVQYSGVGHLVLGVDINQGTVDLVNRGIEPFPGEFGLSNKLRAVVDSGRLKASTDTSDAVRDSDVVVVVVPLYVDEFGAPDFAAMDAATTAIGKGLTSGTLVTYETTLPVGTTRDRLTPLLEEYSGLQADKDFSVVFSPERVLTGRVFEDLRKYPKLVGGISPRSEEIGSAFYEAVLGFDERPDLNRMNGVWRMGSCEAAEMAKLAETTYRDVNIGLANQFAMYSDTVGVDFYKIIEACNSQPFSHIHYPGVAVGGHCIPIYPQLYMSGDPSASIVQAARETNRNMPRYTVDLLESALPADSGKTVVILGLAYRGDIKETAFSGALYLHKELLRRGFQPLVHDPLYSHEEISSYEMKPYQFGTNCDAVILQAEHGVYKELLGSNFPGARVFIDGRNFLRKKNFPGLNFMSIGDGIKKSNVRNA